MKQTKQDSMGSDLDSRIAGFAPVDPTISQQRLKENRSALQQSIRPRASGEPAPLSYAQQRLWFLDLYEPNSAVYNLSSILRLEGALNVGALERSLKEIVRRHEALRTTFSLVEGGEPVQVIGPAGQLALSIVDLRDRAESERETEARRRAIEESQRLFDLARGPLFRASLIRLREDDHVLMLVMHHIVSDGWSVGVLHRELSSLYRAFVKGDSAPLKEPPIQYADFAVWQREWFAGELFERQLSYWKEQLDGIPAVLDLPTDRPRPAVQSHRGKRENFDLSKELTNKLKALSRSQGVTLFMTLLAAVQTLLHRYTGQNDIVVGSPIANRNRTDIEDLIGFFVNTLVLRASFEGNPTVKELLARVRESALGAYEHQDLPFEKLVEELKPERNLSHSPLFQVMLVLQNAPKADLSFENLRGTPLRIGGETAKFDLTLSMQESPNGLEGSLQYNTDLFDYPTIRRMLEHFRSLLEAMVANPNQPVGRLEILREAERRQLLVEWNDTKRDIPKDQLVHRLFEGEAKKSPDAVAVIFEYRQVSYRELNIKANQLAHYLQKLGVGPEVLVGVCMERSVEMIVGLLGVLKAGGAYVPLDPAYPRERLGFVLKDTRTPVLLTQQKLVDSLPEHGAQVVCLDKEGEPIGRENEENPESGVHFNNLAYVIYTSGSTGRPKGVGIEHRSTAALLQWAKRTFTSEDLAGVLASTSICFDLSVFELFAPLISGGKVILAENALHLSTLRRARDVTLVNTVPSAMAELIRMNGVPPSVRTVCLAGEPLQTSLVEQIYRQRTVQQVFDLYGPSEDTTYSTCALRRSNGPGTIGRPIANTQVYLLDRCLSPVPAGIAGDLYIGGEGLARGYLNHPAQTAEKFIPNPFTNEAGARLYRTGDRARYLPDGNIEFLGRIDNQVKIRGFRIELGEVETTLKQCPGIDQAVVMAREVSPGDRRIIAYIVSKQNPSPIVSTLRNFLKEKLPEYMVPSAFMFLDDLPLSANGKLDRQALPAFEFTRDEQQKRFVAPRDALELQLTQVWEKVLGIRPVGIGDNFFDLGGHSLLAVRLVSEIERIVGKELPLATLFRAPTIEQLGHLIREQDWSAPWRSLVAIQPGGSRPPFFCVHAHDGGVLFWRDLARHLGPDQPFYALQPKGLDGKQRLHHRIEEMAAHYVEEIRRLQPEGPYSIGGHCLGGVIAFEMAQQLAARGEKMGLLALFDSYAPLGERAAERSILQRSHYKAVRFFETAILHAGNLGVLESGERLPYIKEKFDKALYKLYMSLGSRWIPAARVRRDILTIASRAMRSYSPKVYPGKITLFRAANLGRGLKHEPQMGWDKLAGGGLTIHVIPGYHAHIVLEPRVRLLAKKLIAALSKVQETSQSEYDVTRSRRDGGANLFDGRDESA